MTITRNNPQTLNDADGKDTYTLSYTVPAGNKRVLVVTAHLQDNAENAYTASCTYGGAAMTEGKTETTTSTNRRYRTYVWYLVAPTVGTADVVVSVTVGLAGAIVAAETLLGAAQTGTVGITAATTTTGTGATLTMNSVSGGSLIIAAVTSHSGGPPTWSWSTATESYDLNNGNDNSEVAGSGATYAVPANGNASLTATRSASGPAVAVGVEFISVDETMAAGAGSFALTGQDAAFRFRRMAAGAGSFALAGQDAALRLVIQILYGFGPSSTPQPAVQVLVGDASGRVLGEIRPLVERVSWELRGIGSGALVVGRGAVDDGLVRAGNRVLVRTDTGLPAWGGVMTGGMEWDAGGRIHIDLAGLLHLLKWRTTPAQLEYKGRTADTIIGELAAMGGLAAGTLAAGVEAVDATYNFAKLYDAVEALLEIEDMVLEIEADEQGGAIVGTVGMFRRGSRTAGGLLVEGHNAREIIYREEDALLNLLHVIGGGEGWTPDTRAMATVTDVENATRYGTREDAVFVDEVLAVNALAAMGEVLVARQARPRRAAQLTATNRSPARFAEYGVGDLIRTILPGYGFGGVDGLFEVVGREYFPGRNVCDLVLEEN